MSGREVCPEDVYGEQEIHINGDVTLAFQQYLYLTEVFGLRTITLWLCVCVCFVSTDVFVFTHTLGTRICPSSQRAEAARWSTVWPITGFPERPGTPMTRNITSWVVRWLGVGVPC